MATTINLSSLDGNNGFRLDGEVAEDLSGFSVGNAGDVNGDGFDDVIVHALTDDPSSSVNYVVFGKASGFDATMNLSSLDGSNGFRLEWKSTYDFAGFTVSSAGDVNGDGFDDLIVSANVYGNGSDTDYIVFGKASGFSATIDQSSLESSLDGNNGFRLEWKSTYDFAGLSVSNAGDVNGDGFGDVIVGARYADYNGTKSGSSYVVFGKASGFSATLDLSSLDGSNGFRLDGETEYEQSGRSVSSAGDVNGDGFDDVIVGARFANKDGGYYTDGASYVVFGKASGFNATMDLSSLDGSNGFRLDGAGDQSGSSVRSAGDVNGDSFDDVLVGARVTSRYGSGPDTSYVVFGKASGFDAAMNLSRLDGYNGFRLEAGLTPYDDIAFNSAGDINGDGFDDLIIGEGNAGPNGDRSGSSYIVFGKASGFAAILDVPSLDSTGLRLDGVAAGDISGNSVSSAGDVNNDGFDDVIIGAFGADPNGESSGSSYVVFGRNEFTDDVIRGTSGDDVLIGTPEADRFEAGDGNDSIDGRGGADLFSGGAGDDTIAVADLDFQLVDGGTDTDTLKLTGSGLNLDLANFRDTIIDIETIDLTGSGDNTLTLSLPDLDFRGTLTVNGNSGDRVVALTGGWTDAGIDGDYRIFMHSGAMLRVDRDVSADVPLAANVINLADLDGSNGFRLDGAAEYDTSGLSVSNAGDVNGDGFDDLIVGALGADPKGQYSGSSYVVFGKAAGFDVAMDLSSLDGSNGFRLDGAAEHDTSGRSVSNAGDVNGDGFDDLIVGALSADPNGQYSGSSYVVFGKASGFDAAMDLSSLDGSNGFRLDGVRAYDLSGFSVSDAGDVNGDGFDDLIVGAPYADPNDDRSGSCYVVFGRDSGFNATLDLSSLDGSNGFRLDGASRSDNSGYSVSNAGDVNGDGFDDLIIGASGADPNGNYSGSSYVVFGKALGFDAAMSLSSLDGTNGFRLDGAAYDHSGRSVSSAGDINDDGFDDLIVGAPNADLNGDLIAGSSYVVFGKASGFAATLDLSSLDGNNGFRLDGEASGDHSSNSVSNAGDVNGDGFDDVIIGAPNADPNGFDSGSSYVVFGRASDFDAALNLSSLDGSNGFRLDGVAEFDTLGWSVSSAGDVNNDGFDDLLIGSPHADPNGEFSGSSYVVFGRSSFTDDGVIRGTPGDDVLTGTPEAERFEAGDGNDRMIGRGGADEFLGEAGDDYIRVSDLDFRLVDGGIGNDILALGGSNLNLNLTDMSGKISGIETIRLFGTGDNTLTLTAADVLNLSDTTNTLRVNGNAGDRIVGLSHGWGDGGIHGDFHTFFNDAAVLLVGVNVTTDFA